MAKVGFWLQGSTGKLAGSALQKGSSGGTIIRQIVKAKNPKTSKQSAQRVFMNTCIQAYAALKMITTNSFQGVEAGQKSMSRFMSLNLGYLRRRASEVGDQLDSLVNFAPIGEKGIRPARFIISEGTLPTVPVSITSDAFLAKFDLAENTYQAILDKYDLKRGDQITLVTIEKHTVDQRNYAHFARVILDPRDINGDPVELSQAFITDQGGINYPNSRNEGNFKLLAFDTDHVQWRMSDGLVCCAGVIVSRESNGTWMRSYCQMVLSEEAIATEAISLPEAINLSRQGYSIDLNDEDEAYLNNAGVGGGQSTNSGQSSGTSTTPTVSNTLSITANGSTVSQSAAGGSVSVTAPLTKVVISGTNLNSANLTAESSAESTVSQLTCSDNNTKATWEGSVAAGYELTIKKNGSTWCVISATAGGDEPGEDRP